MARSDSGLDLGKRPHPECRQMSIFEPRVYAVMAARRAGGCSQACWSTPDRTSLSIRKLIAASGIHYHWSCSCSFQTAPIVLARTPCLHLVAFGSRPQLDIARYCPHPLDTMESKALLALVDQLDGNLDGLEEALDPLLQDSLSATTKRLPILDRAKLNITVVYAVESLLFCASKSTSHREFADSCQHTSESMASTR